MVVFWLLELRVSLFENVEKLCCLNASSVLVMFVELQASMSTNFGVMNKS